MIIIRYALALIGWILILVGIIVTPMPIPLGIPMIAVGVALVAPTSPLVRRLFRRLRERFPKFDRGLEKMHPRSPRFIQILIEQTRPGEEDHEAGSAEDGKKDGQDGKRE